MKFNHSVSIFLFVAVIIFFLERVCNVYNFLDKVSIYLFQIICNLSCRQIVILRLAQSTQSTYCSVERTNLQLIHKEIVHKKITELNVLYLSEKLILIQNDTKINSTNIFDNGTSTTRQISFLQYVLLFKTPINNVHRVR